MINGQEGKVCTEIESESAVTVAFMCRSVGDGECAGKEDYLRVVASFPRVLERANLEMVVWEDGCENHQHSTGLGEVTR